MRTHLIIVSLVGLIAVAWIHSKVQIERDRGRVYQLEQEQSTARRTKQAMPAADLDELDRLHRDAVWRRRGKP